MKKLFTYGMLALALVAGTGGVQAQVNGTAAKAIASTPEKPIFYYIESAADGSVNLSGGGKDYRGNLLYVPNATSGVNIKHDKLETISAIPLTTDYAMWQMIIEKDTVKLKNKATGLYMKDARFGRTTSATRFTAFPLTTTGLLQYSLKTSDQVSPGVAWNSTANGNYIDRWGSTAPNSQVAWYFIVAPGSEANYAELYPAAIKADLAAKIVSTQSMLSTTAVGVQPGMFTESSRTDLLTAIQTAQSVHDNAASGATEYQTAITDLNNAGLAYLATCVKPSVSDATTTKWYFLQGTRPANSYMTSTGSKLPIIGKTVIPDDTQLWKFVANTKGSATGFALVNKATGEYLSANTPFNTAVSSIDTMPSNNLRFIVSDIYTNKTARFWIEHVTGSTPAFRLHAGNTNVMNWNGNAYDNSSWLILDYSNALKTFLSESLAKAGLLLNNVSEGIVYTAENRTTLSNAQVVAQAVYDNAASTDQQMIDAKATLDAAISSHIATAVVSPEKLLSENQGNYRWYQIKSTATHAYAKDKVISLGTRVVGGKFTFEPAVAGDDKQLFRVELTEDKLKVKNIINKSAGNFMAPNGAVSDTAFVANDFAITLLTDGRSVNIKPATVNALHAQESGTHMVNWAGDAGSASAWSFEFVMETPKVVTATTELQSDYRILVQNGRIVVEGVDSFEVYSVTGQRQSLNTELQQGVYIVKSAAFTAKVMIR